MQVALGVVGQAAQLLAGLGAGRELGGERMGQRRTISS
jgi:hypothetical protein